MGCVVWAWAFSFISATLALTSLSVLSVVLRMLPRSTYSENSHHVSTPTISGSKNTKAIAVTNTSA